MVRREGPPVAAVDVVARTPLTDAEPLLDLLVLAVSFADGGARAALPAAASAAAHEAARRAGARHDRPGRRAVRLRRAVGPRRVTAWLLEAIREGRTVGAVRFVPEPGAEARRRPGRAG